MSYVCPIHEQYVHDDKRCPYCVEPEALPDGNYAGVLAARVPAINIPLCFCRGVMLHEGQAVRYEPANGNDWHEAMRCGYGFRPKPIWFDHGAATAILKKYYGGGG